MKSWQEKLRRCATSMVRALESGSSASLGEMWPVAVTSSKWWVGSAESGWNQRWVRLQPGLAVGFGVGLPGGGGGGAAVHSRAVDSKLRLMTALLLTTRRCASFS